MEVKYSFINILLTQFCRYITILIILSGCIKEDRFIDFSEAEIMRLISGDSTKQWVRTRQVIDGKEQNNDECILKHKLTFIYLSQSPDKIEYQIHRDPDICHLPDSIIESGSCHISDLKPGPNVKDTISFIVGQDTTRYGINFITSLFLNIKCKKNGVITESDYEWIEN
jgi:hypothetical protein